MKSFSSTSFASDYAEHLARAQAAVDHHPQALFTDFQWFLFEGKDTVFFTAPTAASIDKDGITALVAEMVSLAPQLTHGFVGARPGQPFPQHILDAITSIEYVDSFDGYPDKWLGKSHDLFERDDLPLFRMQAAVLRGGPDEHGRASMIQVRASHALLEGSDSALLTRGQTAAHGVMSNKKNKVPFMSRVGSVLKAQSMTWTYLILANLLAVKEKPWGFATLAIERQRIRQLASKLGVRQRSLMFALATYALNGDGPEKYMSKKVIGAAYTMLDGKRHAADDDFFRVRALMAKFKVHQDFVAFVREIDDTMGTIESKDITKFQLMAMSMFTTLRNLNRLWKKLPGKRFWRFNADAHVVLTLVPPHHTNGPITRGMMEPIYCGAWHSAANIITFCPGREYLTMNFSMEQRHIDNVHKVMPLLEQLEARALPPTTRAVVDDEA